MRCNILSGVLGIGCAVCVLLAVSGTGGAQGVTILNPSLEQGQDRPEGWTLSGGEGQWLDGDAADGDRAVAVTGDGQRTTYWRSEALLFKPSTAYRISFWARSINAVGGTPITGPVFCNRDLGAISREWSRYTSIFFTPETLDPEHSWVRFGQWHVRGTVAFDRVELMEAQPIYTQRGAVVLGEGERIRGPQYTFTAPFRTSSRNHSRPLVYHNGTFNTDRWVFGANSVVVYRHQIAGQRQTQAEVEVTVGYYRSGELAVEVSVDGRAWRELGVIGEEAGKTFAIPGAMLPIRAVWIRLRSRASNAVGADSDPGSFQVNAYGYRATIEGEPMDLQGSTRFVAVAETDPRLQVMFLSLGEMLPGGENEIIARVENTTDKALILTPTVKILKPGVEVEFATPATEVPPGERSIVVPYDLPGSGSFEVELSLRPDVHFRGSTEVYVAALFEASYGERLPGSSDAVGLWWASSGWKVSQTRPVPTATGEAMVIRAAKNETEAAQWVLRPAADLIGLMAQAGGLTGPGGAVISAEHVEVLRVRYVPVSQPTDATGAAALWPDPLPPFREPITVRGGTNQPLWVRVKVPPDAVAGRYSGSIRLTANQFEVQVPLQVDVYDFQLPDRMTCTTAFGFSPGNVFRYQKISDPAQQRAVLDRYLENYSAHHISPYDPAPLDGFKVHWKDDLTPQFDWEAWDAAMEHALSVLGFNSFLLPVQGLGGGSFHARTEPSLLGFAENAPQYQTAFRAYVREIERHLREKGWLDEAYVYWFDEPDPKDYTFVMNGFRKLKEHAPGINRMLTEQVEPELVGGPSIWCPLTSSYDFDKAQERRQAGDTFWWYVCTVPKAPYVTLFMDHPATELRVWLWQSWKNKIEGILVWQTNYWTSSAAYPDHLQNPYEDPMGWVSGYGTRSGTRQPWGNGDGRFVYPPETAADGRQKETVLEGPVDSIRWEMLRDGIEDYEYFALLSRLLEAHGDELSAEERAKYEGLLDVPAAVSEDVTRFTQDPAPLEAHRDALARAIEKLSNQYADVQK